MKLSMIQVDEAAELLHAAQQGRAPIGPLSARYPGLGVVEAYAIQQVNLFRRLRDGRRVVGHKIGLTSEPMQILLGVDEPDFGYLLDDMVVAGTSVPAARFCAPRVEPEVAFLLREPLRGPGVTAADVRAATEAVAAALEIVDSRIANWALTLPDTVADNASSGAVVLGDWVTFADGPVLADVQASLSLNGTEIDTGTGSAVMGDPAEAVAWLANALSPFGTEIRPGEFVISGSYTTAASVQPGDHACATIGGLGTVSLTFT
ncbi:2-keto-4-pentenoate hydratase [Mycobacterium kansasii]|uniref:Fumarylacetoacetate (FAA) hydrolase family protein n=3 Tax=Mycobacterium kansasii TaxID=1768 RepID=A0A1V3XRR9_MYCKA|nr:fumarylacetoacetate hydrolase family protein [Mycobacterium kansasii]EUA02815.1 fumarylacetoacetate (FAA) hydrolase family protein [Mycobacterium kansasii 824]AGZ52735.1 2-keto-4-pentenoate hydratase [Mycobacterium kansasii ATCC 12478]ARG55604.1 2-keto-4-pentenoate hydratase [Mycobacterium kansasii]ARG61048.1 2-keto-4-pentenoate hydratase [Mycobacterium kansasii]ARG68758.1 2-keto-4-pentenoate hydratase [Mycobacterium kansasii]